MIKHKINQVLIKNIYSITLLLIVNCALKAQVDVYKFPSFDATGNIIYNKNTNDLAKTINLYKYIRTKDDTLLVLKKFDRSMSYCKTKYFASFNNNSQLTYLKYKDRRVSVDGGGGKGIYIYKYDVNGVAVKSEIYEKRMFGYKLISIAIYDPVSKKITYTN